MNDLRAEQIRKITRTILDTGVPKTVAYTEATAQALLFCAAPLFLRLADAPFEHIEEIVDAGWQAMIAVAENR